LKCKREGLIPIFARPKLAINVPQKTRRKIAKLIIETEINNKQKVKIEVKKELKKSNDEISNVLSYVTFQALKYRIRKRLTQKKRSTLIHP